MEKDASDTVGNDTQINVKQSNAELAKMERKMAKKLGL